MENIFSKQHTFESSQEENLQTVADKWARGKVLYHDHKIDQMGAEVRDLKKIVNKLIGKRSRVAWGDHISISYTMISDSLEIPIGIKATFKKLEEDFSDFSNRIVWCNKLKNCLSKFEEELEEYDAKYLSWFVSTLKDVFSYNYAETITKEQLYLLKNGIETIYEKQENCDKDSFAEYHLQLVESGLSLLPTTQKAIDEFGE